MDKIFVTLMAVLLPHVNENWIILDPHRPHHGVVVSGGHIEFPPGPVEHVDDPGTLGPDLPDGHIIL